jgi:hypothetical protein
MKGQISGVGAGQIKIAGMHHEMVLIRRMFISPNVWAHPKLEYYDLASKSKTGSMKERKRGAKSDERRKGREERMKEKALGKREKGKRGKGEKGKKGKKEKRKKGIKE